MLSGQVFVLDEQFNMASGHSGSDGFSDAPFQDIENFGHFDVIVGIAVIDGFDFHVNADFVVTVGAFAEARHTFHNNSLNL